MPGPNDSFYLRYYRDYGPVPSPAWNKQTRDGYAAWMAENGLSGGSATGEPIGAYSGLYNNYVSAGGATYYPSYANVPGWNATANAGSYAGTPMPTGVPVQQSVGHAPPGVPVQQSVGHAPPGVPVQQSGSGIPAPAAPKTPAPKDPNKMERPGAGASDLDWERYNTLRTLQYWDIRGNPNGYNGLAASDVNLYGTFNAQGQQTQTLGQYGQYGTMNAYGQPYGTTQAVANGRNPMGYSNARTGAGSPNDYWLTLEQIQALKDAGITRGYHVFAPNYNELNPNSTRGSGNTLRVRMWGRQNQVNLQNWLGGGGGAGGGGNGGGAGNGSYTGSGYNDLINWRI